MTDLCHTAMHEAGHAVMGVRQGAPIGVAFIVPEEGMVGGCTDDTDWTTSKAAASAAVLVLLAGYASLSAAAAEDPDAGCETDFAEAVEALRFWSLGTLEEWKAKAVEIMARPENRRAVAVVSKRLLSEKLVVGHHVGMLVEFSDGRITEPELQRREQLGGY